MKSSVHRYLLWGLCALFAFTYPFGVIGVAFDVKPPFPMEWAGSFMLYLQGIILIVAAMSLYGYMRPLLLGVCVIIGTYLVETVGVQTGFPFGIYRYTGVLFLSLPGSAPLAVMFAWVLVVFGSYGIIVKHGSKAKRGIDVGAALWGALLAILLDLAIEPVAAHVVLYWEWLSPGALAYYGVPLANFVAWFVVAFVLLLLADGVLRGGKQWHISQEAQVGWNEGKKQSKSERLAMLAPRILFGCSLFMFGLVDLTHGYYWGTILAALAGMIILLKFKSASLSALQNTSYSTVKR